MKSTTAKVFVRDDVTYFVNSAFISQAVIVFSTGALRIPLGWRIAISAAGKDCVLFVMKQNAIEGDVNTFYQVVWDGDYPNAWNYIQKKIPHTRITVPHVNQNAKWRAFSKLAAGPSGLYGHTKSIQNSCEAATRKVMRCATKIINRVYNKDSDVLNFLDVHMKRTKSLPAKILIQAWRESQPQIGKVAKTRGLYGFANKTVNLGLVACAELREQVGLITAELISRKEDSWEKIVDFFTMHSKKGRCFSSKLILLSAPEPK